jgi:hypothetical protein
MQKKKMANPTDEKYQRVVTECAKVTPQGSDLTPLLAAIVDYYAAAGLNVSAYIDSKEFKSLIN